jgi:SPP1 family predicted phage head-tail adaptor
MMSGRLDRKITLQKPTTSRDAYGGQATSWTDEATVWAQVQQQSGRELFAAGKLAEVDALFKIRYRSDVDETWQVVYDGRTYDIQSVKELGRKDGLEIVGKAQV